MTGVEPGRRWLRAAAVAGAYALTGKAGILFAIEPGVATAVWPPSGIAFAAVLVWGRDVWPGIWLGSVLVNIGTLYDGAGVASGILSALVAAWIGAGSTAQALLGVRLLRLLIAERDPLGRAVDFFRFAAVAAGSCAIASTIGVGSLVLGGFMPRAAWAFAQATWWLGDFVGIVVAASAILAWRGPRPAAPGLRAGAEAAGVLASLWAAGQAVFGGWLAAPLAQSLAYLMLPSILWSAFRFGCRGITAALLAGSALAIRGTLAGLGPFSSGTTREESLLLLQAFLGVLAVTGLAVAALLAEREEARAALVRARDELERKVSERTETLARSNVDLEQFAYVASHDLQEPVRKILIFSERLRAAVRSLDAGAQDSFARIESAAKRMRQLIDALLKLSKASRDGIVQRNVDLDALAREVVAEWHERVAEAQAAVEVRELAPVFADADQMRQLLENLLSNALKFRSRERPPRVLISSRKAEGERVAISIEDNGVGFDEKFLDRIFKPFSRLHGRGEYEGSGIGLSICRRIVERHGGEIKARSVLGRGTTFTVTLPGGGAR